MELVGAALPEWMHRERYSLGQVLSFALAKFKQYSEFLVVRTIGLAIVVVIALVPILYFQELVSLSMPDDQLVISKLAQWLFSSLMQALIWFGFLPLYLASMLAQGAKPKSIKRSIRMLARLFGCAIAQILPLVPLAGPVLFLFGIFFLGGPDALGPYLNPAAWLDLSYDNFLQRFIFIYLGTIALIVFGIYISLGLAFAALEVVCNDDASVISALNTSWNISRRNRTNIYLSVAMIGLLNVCGLMTGIGLLVTVPLSGLLWCALFLTLRNGADVSVIRI